MPWHELLDRRRHDHMKGALIILSLLSACARAANFSELIPESRNRIFDFAAGQALFALMTTSQQNYEQVKRFLIQNSIMRTDAETGLFHPDYSHPSWCDSQLCYQNALTQFPVDKKLYSCGPAFTHGVGIKIASENRVSIIELLEHGGYADFIMRLLRERGLKLRIDEVSAVLQSNEFSTCEILEITVDIDSKMSIEFDGEFTFAAQTKLVPSMIQGTFNDEDLLVLMSEKDHIHVCFLHCLVKYHCFEAVAKVLSNPDLSFHTGPSSAVQHLVEEIAKIDEPEIKSTILKHLSQMPNYKVSSVTKLYLADESGHGIFDLPLHNVSEYDYHVFNILFGPSPLGKRFSKDLRSGLLTLTTGSKNLLHTLRKSYLTEAGYKRLIKGLSFMFATAYESEAELQMLTINATTLLLAFTGFENGTNCHIFIRELLLDQHIPFEINKKVVPVLLSQRLLPRVPLVESLMRRGINTRGLLLILSAIIDMAGGGTVWEYLEAVVGHADFNLIAPHIFELHIRKNGAISGLLQLVMDKLTSPTFILSPLCIALGRAILKCARGKEQLSHHFANLSSADANLLLPLLFTGILTYEEMDKLHESIVGSCNLPFLPEMT